MEFRPMRRVRQQLTTEDCEEILRNATSGTLAVLGDGGYPYAVPLCFVYADGVIYFHSAKSGHKIDAIKNCNKASFCVMDQGFKKEGDWALNINSVIAFGKIELITDIEQAKEICTHLVQKFTDDPEYLEKELANALSRVQCFVLTIEHMTGKLVNES